MDATSVPQSPCLNPTEKQFDVEEWEIGSTKLHQKNQKKFCDAIMTTRNRISNMFWKPCHKELRQF